MSQSRARRLLTRGRKLVLFQIIGQLALVAVTPVLTRLVDVPEMGIYQLAISTALIAQPLATFRTEYEIPVSPTAAASARLVRTAWLWTAAVTTVLAIGFVLGHLRDIASGASIAAAVAFVLVAYSMTAVNNAQLIRHEQVDLLGLRNLLTGPIAAVLQVLLAIWWHNGLVLAIGLFLGRAIAQIITRLPRQQSFSENSHETAPSSLGRALRMILAGMLGNASSQAVVLLSGATYGTKSAGELGLSQRIVGAPTSLAGQGLSQMFTSTASDVIRNGRRDMTRSLRSVLLKLLLLSSAMSICIAVLAPWLTPIVLGESWQRAGLLIAILAVPLSFQLVIVPLSGIFMLVRRDRTLLFLQGGRLVAIVAAIVVGQLLSWGFTLDMIVVAIVWSLSYAAFILAALGAMRSYDKHGLVSVAPAP